MDDQAAVPNTGLDDLNRSSLLRTIERAEKVSSVFRRLSPHQVAHRLGILADPSPDSAVTLAGLLTFGDYPQRLFPQLHVAYVVHGPDAVDRRFLDNRTLRGSIGTIVSDAVSAFTSLSMTAAVIDGYGRTEVPSLPLVAFREAIVNALAHRTYHPSALASGIMVSVYPDRVAVASPGGIYGGQSVEDLGLVPFSLARNGTLLALLSDTFLDGTDSLIAENRASGLLAMRRVMEEHGFAPPVFSSTPLAFQVELPLRAEAPEPESRLATADAAPTPRETIMALLASGAHTTSAVADALGVSASTARRHLNALVTERAIVVDGAKTSPKRAYRLPGK